jgi:2-oxo-3-hexenedioate decarboxylase
VANHALVQELMAAYSGGRNLPTPPPTERDANFNLPAAYAVEAELVRLRRASGRSTVGVKVGFANKALWRVFKLDTLVWAHMYDDTVRFAEDNAASLTIGHMYSPKIEPEVVFRMRSPVGDDARDAGTVLSAVEWFALGFEIIDCVYPDWKFTPADFVAAFGLHRALIVGSPEVVVPDNIAGLVDRLSAFKIKLLRNEQIVEEGSGKNSLRSPALCLAELAAAVSQQPGAEPLAAGDLVSSGTLTESRPIVSGESWRAVVDGLELPALTLVTKA